MRSYLLSPILILVGLIVTVTLFRNEWPEDGTDGGRSAKGREYLFLIPDSIPDLNLNRGTI